MQIEVKASEPLTLNFNGTVYNIRRPKIGDIRDMMKALKEGGQMHERIDSMAKLCVGCGVPQEVVDNWDEHQLGTFFTQLTAGEKKTSPETNTSSAG